MMTLRASSSPSQIVTLLVLGAGWTWQFLQPLLHDEDITYAATTSTGHDGTITFRFDSDCDDLDQFKKLPTAQYVLVTFPLKGRGPSNKLLKLYAETHPQTGDRPVATKWIQLGSTGIYTNPDWNSSSSPIDESNERGIAEEELLSLGGCVLNLAGLYGGSREPKNWLTRVAKTREQLGAKGALHLIHGRDVARAVVSVMNVDMDGAGSKKEKLFGRRWIVADCVSYDWWSLVWEWTGKSHEGAEEDKQSTDEKLQYRRWVVELMDENNVRGLPRSVEALGRKLDARDFWKAIGTLPERTLAR